MDFNGLKQAPIGNEFETKIQTPFILSNQISIKINNAKHAETKVLAYMNCMSLFHSKSVSNIYFSHTKKKKYKKRIECE